MTRTLSFFFFSLKCAILFSLVCVLYLLKRVNRSVLMVDTTAGAVLRDKPLFFWYLNRLRYDMFSVNLIDLNILQFVLIIDTADFRDKNTIFSEMRDSFFICMFSLLVKTYSSICYHSRHNSRCCLSWQAHYLCISIVWDMTCFLLIYFI